MLPDGRGWCLVIAGNNKQASEQDQVHEDDNEARIRATALMKDDGAIEPEAISNQNEVIVALRGEDCSSIRDTILVADAVTLVLCPSVM